MPQGRVEEDALIADTIALASQYGRYGYWRITALLRETGWAVNVKRFERIWRRAGLKVPQKRPKNGRLWLDDVPCIGLRSERSNHVWSYNFIIIQIHDRRKFRVLNLVDEFGRKCLATRIDRLLRSPDVIDVLSDRFILSGVPSHIGSDNGPKFVAKAVPD